MLDLRPLALVALLLPAAGADLSDTERANLFARLSEIRRETPGATATFREEKTSPVLKRPVVTEGTIAFSPPSKFRREIRGAHPSTAVCDGRDLWIHYPAFGEVERYPLGRREMFDRALGALTAGLDLDQLEKTYKVRAAAEGDGFRLELRPKDAATQKVVEKIGLWLDRALLLERTEIDLAGGGRSVITFRDVRRAALPDRTFEFTPPAGAKITTPLGPR
jgi:outer membrane lipoprotein-sorting protein